MAFSKLGALVERVNSTVTSGGTLTLANNSASFQQFTGTLAHTVVLPQANASSPNECPIGLKFVILNRSTDDITVNYNGGVNVATVTANSQKTFRLTDNATSEGVWDVTVEGASGTGLSDAQQAAVLAALASSKYADASTVTGTLKVDPEAIGGNYWSTRTELPASRAHAASFSVNNSIYTGNGRDGSNPQPNYWKYNDVVSSWTSIANSNSSRTEPLSVSASRGYLFGGTSNLNAEYYNDVANTWTSIASLAATRQGAGGGFLRGNIYILGGYVGGSSVSSSALRYDETLNSYLAKKDLPSAKASMGRVVGPKFLHLLGGNNGSSPVSDTQAYNDVTDSFYSTTALPGIRFYGASFAACGKGYYLGGHNGSVIATGVSLDFDSDSYASTSSMPTAKYDLTSVGVSLNGSGYAVGGTNIGETLANSNFQYVPYSLFNVSIVKSSFKTPTSIVGMVSATGITANLPMRVRTDGDQWHWFMSGSSVLTINGDQIKLAASPNAFMVGGSVGVQNNCSKYNEGSDTWSIKATAPTGIAAPGRFSLNGYGYVSTYDNGTGTLLNSTQRYDEYADSWLSRANNPNSTAYAGGFSVLGKGYINCGSTTGLGFNIFSTQYDDATNTWATKNNTLFATNSHGSTATNETGWIGGGYAGGTRIATTATYDPVTDTWTGATAFNSARTDVGGVVLGGLIYGLGGQNNDPTNLQATDRYDLGTKNWTVRTSFATPRRGLNGHASRIGDKIYISGGYTSVPTGIHDQHNAEANTWTTKTAMNYSNYSGAMLQPGFLRKYELQVGLPTFLAATGGGIWKTNLSIPLGRYDAATFSLQGKMQVINGSTGSALTDSYEYDPGLNFWKAWIAPPINSTFGHTKLTPLSGFGFVLNGFQAVRLSSNFIVNPDILSWLTKASFPYTVNAQSGASSNGFLYTTGGLLNSGLTSDTYRYSLNTDAWVSRATLSANRYSHVNFSVDGFVFAVTGSVNNSPTTLTTLNERYNDSSNTWSTAAAIPTGNMEAMAQSFKGKGIVYGGAGTGSSYTDAAYEYNSSSNAWKTRVAMSLVVGLGNSACLNGENPTFAGGFSGSTISVSQSMLDSIKNIVVGAAIKVNE